VRYWNGVARQSEADARDAILCGFRGQRAFDAAGQDDARHLVLPFIDRRSTVLDVGCGIGRILKWVAPACAQVIGLDVSREMLRRARRHLNGLTNVQLRLVPPSLELPVADRTADFAYFYHVSEHLEREQCLKILREVARCLKMRGAALVAFSVLDFPANRREFARWAIAGDPEGVRSRFYSEPEALTLLSMVGLHPQLRLYVPGELVWVVTRRATTLQGAMPLVHLAARTSLPVSDS
jgi:SAM-dependent methyltransferase